MSIGLIDSGIGGLTTLCGCVKAFPKKDYIYIADTFYAPYGSKERGFLKRRTAQLVERLSELGAECVILACNSCSSSTLDENFPLPVIRVLPPAADALQHTDGRVLLLATPVTINSPYVCSINSHRLTKLADCCLATFVENAAPDFSRIKPYLQELLLPFGDYSGIIPGCTHYVYLEEIIKEILPSIRIFDSRASVISALNALSVSTGEGAVKIVITGETKNDYNMLLTKLLEQNTR
ncbi:MAG: aspartate/glutamate racemase family protein [Clostridia bacterium]|nr:aspartate/glutamate racemase family protein [Clostridia bacterium]